MRELKDFLLKFENILAGAQVEVATIQKVIEEVVGIKVEKKDIRVKGDTVYLSVKPIYKNEIFLKQEEIFEKIKNFSGKKPPARFS